MHCFALMRTRSLQSAPSFPGGRRLVLPLSQEQRTERGSDRGNISDTKSLHMRICDAGEHLGHWLSGCLRVQVAVCEGLAGALRPGQPIPQMSQQRNPKISEGENGAEYAEEVPAAGGELPEPVTEAFAGGICGPQIRVSLAATELETDDTTTGPKAVKDKTMFYTEDTTLNAWPLREILPRVMVCTKYGTLMNLTDGGLQQGPKPTWAPNQARFGPPKNDKIMAGSQLIDTHRYPDKPELCSGFKGRYMFEVRIMEVMNPLEEANARARMTGPRNQVLNLNKDSPNAPVLQFFEVSFRITCKAFIVHSLDVESNGKRVSPPQPLPDSMKEKVLYPLITFKNARASDGKSAIKVTVNYNFGPSVMVPLPFRCRTMNELLGGDVSKKKEHTAPNADGQYEVVFPVALPDEGGFDFLDQPSDRSLLNWCEKSGALRNYVVMEIRGNLMKEIVKIEERLENVPKWYGFKRAATAFMISQSYP
ncbi:hypothetical protein AK812_SmicGene15164 [Symbiodinium microadriaticum]|uniref:Uncharacterized protein n=1 Tax=Symbiodinium microadriaticum TaxID=2951 RepID=A0A1Q9E3T5_SYMMI|nr:hypothetical protein AK812_SmicGene15164 [Symbiodinium microadriaticum]